ncbi:MAG TPA: signal recognition particle-docking protein FtsY [Oligoflexia bacterium]|nr:signal recognition particle-docking protein FtsY [Oligoflexia bacterium]HMR24785.1 signal recognition particle-docking protein FtsY [Oligoflexia bacterium]
MFDNLKASQWKQKIRQVFSKVAFDEEQFEALLFQADFSYDVIETVLQELKVSKVNHSDEYIPRLKDILYKKIEALHAQPMQVRIPFCVLLVGINGVGKTTTAGRLAHYWQNLGYHVTLAAADTFRAGAVDQIKLWSERASVDLISQGMGADPASVVYDAWDNAQKKNGIMLADTAGRMHTKEPLMQQLEKMIRVLKKQGEHLPHETLLVLDGTTGQNAVLQSQAFAQTTKLTGIVATKMDGSAKGGAIYCSALNMNLPIRFVGTGEGMEDLKAFDSKSFIDAMFD